MQATSAETSSLHVDRFRAQYLIASDHPAPESVKRRLDDTLHKTLPDALRSALSGWFSDSDSSLWFVRELDVNLDLNLGWNSEQVARTCATQLARKLSRDLSEGNEPNGVVWFPDRAAYLASFLIDLVNGNAWGKWYYWRLDGLRTLPLSAGLRTAICQQLENGLSALLQLTTTDLANVINALNTQDVRRVLEFIAQNESSIDESRCFEALRKAWLQVEPLSIQLANEGRIALRLYLEAHRNGDEFGPTLRNTALAFVRLAVRLETAPESDKERLLAALVSGDVAALYSGTSIGDAEVLLPFTRCSRALVQEIWDDLAASPERFTGSSETADGPVHTTFGGIFLLLPLLDRLPLELWTESWPDVIGGQSAASLMRFLILAKCCGRERFSRAFYDPLLRDLFRIDPTVTTAIIYEWQAHIPRKKREEFRREHALWQRENGAQGGERLAIVRARYRRGAIVLLLDLERGCWLFGMRYRASQQESVVKRMQEWLSGKVVFTNLRFVAALQKLSPPAEIIKLDEASDDSKNDEEIRSALLYLSKVNDDLKYLSSPDEFQLSSSFDLTCSIAAQGLMRNFGWSLPGFSRSGLPYLYRSFLEFAGSLEAEPERYVVRLGRPPLNIILAIAGLQRATYRLRWMEDDKPFMLFQGE